jgi:Domain of unknown function (DUF4395)
VPGPRHGADGTVAAVPATGSPPPRTTDPRPARFEQAVVAVVLLAGFVFGAALLIPVCLVALLVSALVGSRSAPLQIVFHTLLAPRLDAGTRVEPAAPRRFAVLLEAALLAGASLLVLAGTEGLAWVLALVVAGVAALDGATGISAGAALHRRLRHDR